MSEVTTPACPRCGAPVPSSLQFCPACGAAVEPEAGTADSTQRLHAAPAALDEARPNSPEPAAAAPLAKTSPSDPAAGPVLDWEPELVAVVLEAAKIKGTTVARMIRELVEPEARKVVAKSRGLMSLATAAEFLGVAKAEVIAMISAGELKARKIDGEWMVEKTGIGDPDRKAGDMIGQIELDLRELVKTSGLQGIAMDGEASESVSATVCYVTQDGVLVCPRSAWRRMGRAQVVAEAKDAVRRYLRRRDRDAGKI
jgi:hypothetical protein